MKRFLISLLCIITTFCVFPSFTANADDVALPELVVHFIDVGQGDACIIELPDDKTILIDAGENNAGVRTKLISYIEDNIKTDDGNTIEYFDYAIMTHSDSDHIGSMSYVLSRYRALTVYRPNQECKYVIKSDGEEHTCVDKAYEGTAPRNRFWGEAPYGSKNTKTYHEALETIYETADEVIVTNPYDDTQNRIYSEEYKYEINFYSPLSSSYSDNNNYSPIIVVELMGKKIVLTGDAEKENEREFVAAATAGQGRYAVFDDDFCADVIKLGHHGSRTSSSEDYLNVVTKASVRSGVFVIISCGENNKYGHPHPEVLTRLASLGFADQNILRTDKLGDIVVSLKQEGGEYKAVYNGRSGGSIGSGGTSPAKKPGLYETFMGLDLYLRILIIVAVIVVLILAAVIITKSKKKKRKRR